MSRSNYRQPAAWFDKMDAIMASRIPDYFAWGWLFIMQKAQGPDFCDYSWDPWFTIMDYGI